MSTVTQQLEPLFGVSASLASQIVTTWDWVLPRFQSKLAIICLVGGRKWYFRFLHPATLVSDLLGAPCFWFLALAWPRASCCSRHRHLGSKPEDTRHFLSLSPYSFSSSLLVTCFSNKNTQIHEWKRHLRGTEIVSSKYIYLNILKVLMLRGRETQSDNNGHGLVRVVLCVND